MTISLPVAAWGFNKDLAEAAGQYKDYSGGLILTSYDGLDHPAAEAKVGAGAYEANNTQARMLLGPDSFSVASGLSMSVWCRLSTIGNVQDSIVKLATNIGFNLYVVVQVSSTLGRRFGFLLGTPASCEGYVPADLDWHHVAVTFSAPAINEETGYWQSTVRLYVDGDLRLEFEYDFGTEGDPEVPPLALSVNGYPNAGYFNGDIDALHIWHSVLSGDEIAELYNGGAGWEYAPPDTTPDAFAFAPVADADLATLYISNSQIIMGMDAGTAVSITGGEYRIAGGAWTNAPGTIDPGQTLELRGTSSADPATETVVSVTVGTLTVTWSITTAVAAGNALRLVFGQQQLLISTAWKVIS